MNFVSFKTKKSQTELSQNPINPFHKIHFKKNCANGDQCVSNLKLTASISKADKWVFGVVCVSVCVSVVVCVSVFVFACVCFFCWLLVCLFILSFYQLFVTVFIVTE